MMNLLASDVFKDFVEFVEKPFGDEYPIVFFEPNIHSEANKELKSLVQGNKSIRLYSRLDDAVYFVDKTPIGIILIFSSLQNEEKMIKSFHVSQFQSYRRMFDIEEEMLLKDVFKGISDQTRNSLKAFIVFPITDVIVEGPINPDEEEVMVMRDIEEMVNEFQQEYIVIWYDPGASPENKEILTKEVDIEPTNIFTDFQKLNQRIHDPNGIPYHLIMTDTIEAEKIVQKVEELKDSLLSLYIYCDDPGHLKIRNKDKGRKVFVEKTLKDLIPKLKKGIRSNSRLVHSFPAFTTDFDASDRNHVYNLHYYLRGLINFNNSKQAKADFINLAQKIYESKKLFEFKESYNDFNKEDIFKWYAVESPVYKLVNNCLRIATSDSILYCRFVLRDLEKAIQEEYKAESYKENGVVYRGAYISQSEWDKLQSSVGKEIEMYGFLSTSQDLKVAKNFVSSDSQNKILISIIIPPLADPELNKQGFANISKNSNFQEAEILFNVRSKFQILETGTFTLNTQGKQCRHLVLMYGSQLLRKYMTEKKPILNIELELPLDLECHSCKATNNLFGFRKDKVEACCLECLSTKPFPVDTPLLALENQNDSKIVKILSGAMLNFNEKTGLPFYGYKCKDCQEIGKDRYLTWKNLNSGDIKRQCLECFQKNRKVESHLLIYESSPYSFWTEHQAPWETVHSDHQQTLSKKFEENDSIGQSDVYMEVQRFDLCIQYEKMNIQALYRKRKRELKKIQCFDQLAKAYGKLKKYQEALNYSHQIYKIHKQLFGEKDKFTVSSLTSLAAAYENASDYQMAKETSKKALKIMNSLNETDDLELAIAYNNLASFCKTLGKPKKAFKYHFKALEITKAKYGENHLHTSMSHHNIASVYEDVGDWKEALNYYQKAFNIRESIYGEKHITTAGSYNNLGIIHQKMGKTREAIEYFDKAVKILAPIYGEKHPQIATSYNNLGEVYRSLGDHQEAEKYSRKALDFAQIFYGENKSEVSATSFSGLGSLCRDSKQHDKAKDYFDKALSIIKTVFGEKNQKTASSYNNLGLALYSLGQHLRAKESFEKAINITESIYGENHPNNLIYYRNMVEIFKSSEDDEGVVEYLTKALNLTKLVHKEGSTDIATMYHNLGVRYAKLKKHEDAKIEFQKAIDLRKSLLGEKHLDTALSYENLGIIEMDLVNMTSAVECFKNALDIRKSLLEQSDPLIARLYNNMAAAYRYLKDNKEALENYQKALDLKIEKNGEKHPEVANAYIQVMTVELDKNKALNHSIKAYKIIESLYGKDHPSTIAFSSNVKKALQALQDENKNKK